MMNTATMSPVRRRLIAVFAVILAFFVVATTMPVTSYGATKSRVTKTFTINNTPVTLKTPAEIDNLLAGKNAPAKVYLTAQASSMKVTWSSVPKAGGNIDGYVLLRRVGNGRYTEIAKPGKNTTAYVDKGASKRNTNYAYLLMGYKKSGKNIRVSPVSRSVVGVTTASTKKNTYAPTINKKSASVMKGKTLQLKLTYPKNALSTWTRWKSSNTAVATVNAKGLVTAKAAGKAVITGITPNGREIACTVTVKDTAVGIIPSFKASCNSAGKVTMSWKAAKNATSYQVYYKVKGATSGKTVAASKLSASITGLKQGTTYLFYVRGINKTNQGKWTKALTLTIPKTTGTKPTTGGGTKPVTVTVGNIGSMKQSATVSSFTLNWSAANNATAYDVQYKMEGDSTWKTATVTGTSFTANGLAGGVRYDFKVRGKNGSKVGAWYQNTTVYLPLPAPKNLKINKNEDGNVALSWDKVPHATSYVVTYKKDIDSSWTTKKVDVPNVSITGLTQGAKYDFRVQSKNEDANGGTASYSNVLIKTTNTGGDNTGGDNTGGDNTGGDNTGGDNTGGDNTGGDNTGGDGEDDGPGKKPEEDTPADKIPGKVSNFVKEAVSETSFTLSFDKASDATKYNVQYRKDGDTTWINGPSVSTNKVTLNNLTPGTKYNVRVQGANNTKTGSWSNPVNVTTDNNLPVMGNLSFSATSAGQLTVEWSAVAFATSYEMQYRVKSEGDAEPWSSVKTQSSPAVASGLTSGTTYEIRVRGFNGAREGKWSNIGSITIPGNPQPPVVDEDTPGKVTSMKVENLTSNSIVWTFTKDAKATSYEVRYSTDKKNWTNLPDVTEGRIVMNNLTPETTYYVQVRGKNATKTGEWSNYWYITTPEDTTNMPGQIQFYQQLEALTDDSIIFLFKEDPLATSYEVRYSTDKENWINLPDVTEGRIVLTGLSPNTTYYVQARGKNAEKTAPWPNYYCFATTKDDVPVVTGTTHFNYSYDGTLTVTWEAMKNATSYKVQYRPHSEDENAQSAWTQATVNGTKAEIKGLTKGTSYDLRLCGLNGTRQGEWAEWVINY